MIDPVSLSASLARLLMPFLPTVLKAGEKAVDKLVATAGDRIGDEAGRRIAALWRRLWPRLEKSPSARETVEDAAAHPDDGRREAAFSLVLERVLAADPGFAQEIAGLLESARGVLVAGRDVITVQGDDNEVLVGDYNVSIRRARDVTLGDRDRPRR